MPASPAPAGARRSLSQVPRHMLINLIEKVNKLYDEFIKDNITVLEEQEIHEVMSAEYSEAGRADTSLRHLRQASSLLRVVEAEGLVRPGTCYVELGAGKGALSYYAWRAWCGAGATATATATATAGAASAAAAAAAGGSRVLLVDRASLRHKRDNKLRDLAAPQTGAQGEGEGEGRGGCEPEPPTRLRADLAHLSLQHVPAARRSDHLVGLAKHLCGVATDYALRCMTGAGARDKTRGVVVATCCHHRCDPAAFFGREHLQELGISEEEFEILLGVVSWGTCGDGRSRARRRDEAAHDHQAELEHARRASSGRRVAALLDWCRVLRLRTLGLRARLVRYARAQDSPEDVAIVASRPL